ncbi:hypothetical protein CEUSTIGMA_g10710.t1 [Chlamydomonas eustigma]|uniref:Uncharacterized protein n=1 Tax=Chlamydomonas eustigma TaxID=1157962 RepID=A0A250XJN7_9CHLO|nr:hypothetical protein CEUSTIGMA_g10710.t1 [Chlamydomonas eustigma]|eukprot:GAX83284.1 hypothetical protein CEUSTIGMA_g10710.t1 [Chlamydomonas eustigma]
MTSNQTPISAPRPRGGLNINFRRQPLAPDIRPTLPPDLQQIQSCSETLLSKQTLAPTDISATDEELGQSDEVLLPHSGSGVGQLHVGPSDTQPVEGSLNEKNKVTVKDHGISPSAFLLDTDGMMNQVMIQEASKMLKAGWHASQPPELSPSQPVQQFETEDLSAGMDCIDSPNYGGVSDVVIKNEQGLKTRNIVSCNPAARTSNSSIRLMTDRLRENVSLRSLESGELDPHHLLTSGFAESAEIVVPSNGSFNDVLQEGGLMRCGRPNPASARGPSLLGRTSLSGVREDNVATHSLLPASAGHPSKAARLPVLVVGGLVADDSIDVTALVSAATAMAAEVERTPDGRWSNSKCGWRTPSKHHVKSSSRDYISGNTKSSDSRGRPRGNDNRRDLSSEPHPHRYHDYVEKKSDHEDLTPPASNSRSRHDSGDRGRTMGRNKRLLSPPDDRDYGGRCRSPSGRSMSRSSTDRHARHATGGFMEPTSGLSGRGCVHGRRKACCRQDIHYDEADNEVTLTKGRRRHYKGRHYSGSSTASSSRSCSPTTKSLERDYCTASRVGEQQSIRLKRGHQEAGGSTPLASNVAVLPDDVQPEVIEKSVSEPEAARRDGRSCASGSDMELDKPDDSVKGGASMSGQRRPAGSTGGVVEAAAAGLHHQRAPFFVSPFPHHHTHLHYGLITPHAAVVAPVDLAGGYHGGPGFYQTNAEATAALMGSSSHRSAAAAAFHPPSAPHPAGQAATSSSALPVVPSGIINNSTLLHQGSSTHHHYHHPHTTTEAALVNGLPPFAPRRLMPLPAGCSSSYNNKVTLHNVHTSAEGSVKVTEGGGGTAGSRSTTGRLQQGARWGGVDHVKIELSAGGVGGGVIEEAAAAAAATAAPTADVHNISGLQISSDDQVLLEKQATVKRTPYYHLHSSSRTNMDDDRPRTGGNSSCTARGGTTAVRSSSPAAAVRRSMTSDEGNKKEGGRIAGGYTSSRGAAEASLLYSSVTLMNKQGSAANLKKRRGSSSSSLKNDDDEKDELYYDALLPPTNKSTRPAATAAGTSGIRPYDRTGSSSKDYDRIGRGRVSDMSRSKQQLIGCHQRTLREGDASPALKESSSRRNKGADSRAAAAAAKEQAGIQGLVSAAAAAPRHQYRDNESTGSRGEAAAACGGHCPMGGSSSSAVIGRAGTTGGTAATVKRSEKQQTLMKAGGRAAGSGVSSVAEDAAQPHVRASEGPFLLLLKEDYGKDGRILRAGREGSSSGLGTGSSSRKKAVVRDRASAADADVHGLVNREEAAACSVMDKSVGPCSGVNLLTSSGLQQGLRPHDSLPGDETAGSLVVTTSATRGFDDLSSSAVLGLSMIQYSLSFNVEAVGPSARRIYDRSYLSTLQDEGKLLKRRGDRSREANNGHWTPLGLTMHLHSCLKFIEAAYGYEQQTADRVTGHRHCAKLLLDVQGMLSVVTSNCDILVGQHEESNRCGGDGVGVGIAHPTSSYQAQQASPATTHNNASIIDATDNSALILTPPRSSVAVTPPAIGGPHTTSTPPTPADSLLLHKAPRLLPTSGSTSTPTATTIISATAAAAVFRRPTSSMLPAMLQPSAEGSGTIMCSDPSQVPLHHDNNTAMIDNYDTLLPASDMSHVLQRLAVAAAVFHQELWLLCVKGVRLLSLKLSAICRTKWLALNSEGMNQAIQLLEGPAGQALVVESSTVQPDPVAPAGVVPPAAAGSGIMTGSRAAAGSGDLATSRLSSRNKSSGGVRGGAAGSAVIGSDLNRPSPPAAASAADSASSTHEASVGGLVELHSAADGLELLSKSLKEYGKVAETWQRAADESWHFQDKVLALCDLADLISLTSTTSNDEVSTAITKMQSVDDNVNSQSAAPTSSALLLSLSSLRRGSSSVAAVAASTNACVQQNNGGCGSEEVKAYLSAGLRALESVSVQLQGLGYEAGVWDLMGSVVIARMALNDLTSTIASHPGGALQGGNISHAHIHSGGNINGPVFNKNLLSASTNPTMTAAVS